MRREKEHNLVKPLKVNHFPLSIYTYVPCHLRGFYPKIAGLDYPTYITCISTYVLCIR